MATLTLKKSVTKDSVVSKKGDTIFVERKRTVNIPGQNVLTDAPKTPNAAKSAQDEKLRAVLSAAKEREEQRRLKQEEESELHAEREREIAAEKETYASVKEKLTAKQNADKTEQEDNTTRNKPGSVISTPKKSFDDDTTPKKANKKKHENDLTKGKISVRDIIVDEGETVELREEHRRSEASIKRFRDKARTMFKPAQKIDREVTIGNSITVKDLALALAEKVGAVIKKLLGMGMMASQNQSLDADTAELIANEFGAKVKRIQERPFADLLDIKPSPENLKPRMPVVTVVGHVDHGKTSLLDAFRNANVVAGESGGITQHIAAYEVKTKSGKTITFLDTPGHETFSAMRARGAQMADIVVLVVAANDSVKPQTVEALNHIRAAKVPFIVAINKIDLPDANPEKVRTDLLQYEVQVEQLGGDIQAIEISATKKIGLDKLEDAIILQAEMMDLKADPTMPAQAMIVEAKLEHGLGATATVLMKQGTLKIGDIFVVGETWGRIRGLINSFGERVKEIGPSNPAVILGLNSVPLAGDELRALENEGQAREVAAWRTDLAKNKASLVKKSTLEELFTKKNETKKVTLSIILRADVQGSVEAIVDMIKKIETEKAKIDIMSSGVGQITEGDVRLAFASKGIIIAFNVRGDGLVRDLARELGVEIRYHSIIYRITDELKDILAGKLEPIRKENFIGYADVIALFTVGKNIHVAGCRVTEGTIKRDANVRLLRANVVIYDGKIGLLKQEKNEVKEVGKGMEFGMSFDKYNNLEIGDRVECYEIEEIRATL